MTTGAKIGIGLLIFAAIAIPVTIIIVRKGSGRGSTVPGPGSTVTNPAIPVPPPCIPFTKQQQDGQKAQLQAKCANKLLIPFVGVTQYAACMKAIPGQLTPVSNC